MFISGIVFGVVAVIALLIYNSLISKKNAVGNVESTIDVQLNMRYDLIPNLVDAVKEAMRFERETLERIIDLRQRTAGIKASTPGLLAA